MGRQLGAILGGIIQQLRNRKQTFQGRTFREYEDVFGRMVSYGETAWQQLPCMTHVVLACSPA